MQFLCAAVVRVVLGLLLALSLVGALPALPNYDPGAKPGSLLGRSYTRRAAESSIVLASRPLALDAQTQQLDTYRPLGRAARFQVTQRRAAHAPGSLRAADKNDDAQGGDVLEAREILLSHQQLVPSVSSLTPSTTVPAIPTTTVTATSILSTAHVSHIAHTTKSKKTKAKSKNGGHKAKKTAHVSAE
ncbi:hypothetical protein B0H13DRAFT_2307385 [Mycena leptocephala]|nr:hypothetical protein B0H13DRAFT_2307385 [Mycena leptocephala]